MNFACPHCHELLSNDPASGLLPAMCARCGGAIRPSSADAVEATVAAAKAVDAVPPARSFASFLRWNRTETGAAAKPAVADPGMRSEPRGTFAGAQQAASADTGAIRVQDEWTGPGADPGDVAQESIAPVRVEATPADDTPCTAPPDGAGPREPVQGIQDGEPTPAVVEVDDRDSPDASPSVEAPSPPAPAPASTLEEPATPSFTLAPRQSPEASRAVAWQWAALALLALALVLQVLLADRARLAADAQWRPLLTSLCSVFGCSLPTWHEPTAFTMLSRDVRPAPETPGALLVQATFRNDARWSQQWPVMKLSLSDADGRVLGARAFVASEYLGPTATQATLAPGQSAQVMLQVREPQASVVAFAFDFD